MTKFFLLLFTTLFFANSYGQILPADSVFNKKKFRYIVATELVLSSSTISYLGVSWYSGYPKSSFHFFDDSKEWKGMDKLGHANSSYYFGRMGYDFLRYAGVSKKRAIWYGGGVGTAYLTLVEIFDGFSKEWGASPLDLMANVSGSALFMIQQAAWDEQRIWLRYSYHPTDFAALRPNLLGGTFAEKLVKDYNAQTYWLSANISSFLPKQNRFPKWINVAVGYGAEGMTGSFSNPQMVDGKLIPSFERYNQYYLSMDFDLSRIPVRNKTLKGVLEFFSFVKLPFPAIEFNKNGMNFHPLYF